MTIIKIRITTPKGHATRANKNLQPFLIGSKKKLVRFDTYVNEDDNELYWEIETELRRALKITRNVGMYKEMIQAVMGNKKVKKMIKDEAQKEELENMLSNQTEITIIKEADANELVEANKTFWQRIKESFHKKEENTQEE